MLHNSFSKEFFPNIQSKPPLTQLEAISSHPIASYLEHIVSIWYNISITAVTSSY